MDRLRALPGVENGRPRGERPPRRECPRPQVSRAKAQKVRRRRRHTPERNLGRRRLLPDDGNRPASEGGHSPRRITRASLGNIILSQTAANLLWPGQDPIGRRVKRDESRSVGDRRRCRRTISCNTDTAARPSLSCTCRWSAPSAAESRAALLASVRDENGTRGRHRSRRPCSRPRGGPGSADVPRLHDGRTGLELHGPVVVHRLDALDRLDARARARHIRTLRRPVVCRRGETTRSSAFVWRLGAGAQNASSAWWSPRGLVSLRSASRLAILVAVACHTGAGDPAIQRGTQWTSSDLRRHGGDHGRRSAFSQATFRLAAPPALI